MSSITKDSSDEEASGTESSAASEEGDIRAIGGARETDSRDTKRIKSEILAILEPINFAGPYQYHSTDSNPCNPGIHINGYGWLALPFSERDLPGLVGSRKISQDSTGEQLPAVLTWADFTCRNKEWSNYVHKTRIKALQQCGITADCSLSPPILLIYQPGSAGPRQKRTGGEPPNGRFGRLLITLPSEHESFSVSLKHGEQRSNVEVLAEETFRSLSSMWVEGVEHEIRFESSGVLLLLAYDLIWTDPTQKPTAGSAASSVNKLRETLKRGLVV